MGKKEAVYVAHKTRLNPTKEQECFIIDCFRAFRFCYNWGLNRWGEVYEENKELPDGEKKKLNTYALKKEFNTVKVSDFPRTDEKWHFLYNSASRAREDGFIRLGVAFKNFFDILKGKRPKPTTRKKRKDGKPNFYPRFKSRFDYRQSFTIAYNGDTIKLDGHNVKLPRIGWVNIGDPVRFDGRVKNVTISRAGKRYYVAFMVELENASDHYEPAHLSPVGVDLGIKDLAILSDGTVFENAKHLKKSEKKLARLQRKASRQQRGSGRYAETNRRIGRLHSHIANQRKHTIHLITKRLSQHTFVGIEDLNVKGMMSNRKLSKALGDASFGEIQRQLLYKSELRGGTVQKVDTFFPSSQLCSSCGCKNEQMKNLSIRTFECTYCGYSVDRDYNASLNILNEALRMVNA